MREDIREPFDGRKSIEAKLEYQVPNAGRFIETIGRDIDRRDWQSAVQSARGLLDAARALLETAVAREALACIEAGIYEPIAVVRRTT